MSDFLLGLQFWLLFEILSWPFRFAVAPLPMRNDVRRLLSRVAGPLSLAAPVWFAAHLGVRLSLVSSVVALGLGAGVGVGLWIGVSRRGRRPGLRDILLPPLGGRRWRREWGIELLGLALFFGYLAFIRLAPDMNFAQENLGAEKFTNAMLFWSCWHAETLPPQDYWLAGVPQIYYTFGHFFWAWLGRLGGFAPEVVIPLALSRLTLMVWEACYLFARAWGFRLAGAAFGALLMAWGGNPEAIVSAVTQALQIERTTFMAPPYAPEWFLPYWSFGGYYLWDSARVLTGAITEVPAWTATLAEFHSHHLALPWILGFFAVLLGGDRWFRLKGGGAVGPGLLAWTFVLLASAAALTSLWLLPLVALVGLGVFLWPWRRAGPLPYFPVALLIALAAIVFVFIRISSGALPSPPPDPNAAPTGLRALLDRSPIGILGWRQRSTLLELFRHWGFHFALIGGAAGTTLLIGRRTLVQFRLAATAALLLVVQIFILRSDTYLIWFAAAALVAAMTLGEEPWLRHRPGIFLTVACALLGGMEIYYIRDGNPIYVRVNTYFKLSLPLWPLMTLGGWSLAVKLWNTPVRPWTIALTRAGLMLFIPAAFALPVLAMPARTIQARQGDSGRREPTLNSFAWLHYRPGYRAEAQMLDWMRDNVAPRLTVIEYARDIPFEEGPAYRNSQAGSYDYFARVASLAGRPVPLGWPHHEFQWRGAEAEPIIRKRDAAIQRLYHAGSTDEIHEAAMELGATWVVLGKVEREHLGEEQFERLRELLGSAGHLRGAFPENDPRSFVYELH